MTMYNTYEVMICAQFIGGTTIESMYLEFSQLQLNELKEFLKHLWTTEFDGNLEMPIDDDTTIFIRISQLKTVHLEVNKLDNATD